MADIAKLSKPEKIFLAGCIKKIILGDGVTNLEENEELNAIIEQDFSDFDKRLVEFEDKVKEEEDFLAMAATVKGKASRTVILNVIHDLSMHGGFVKKSEDGLLEELKEAWK